jgi:hypothetical protein
MLQNTLEVLSSPTKWSDIYNLSVQTVPQDVRKFAQEKAERYESNGYGYDNKDYFNLPYSIQFDTNAAADEAAFLDLINNNQFFVDSVNSLIRSKAETGEIYVSPKTGRPFIIDGAYEFNYYHGITDHDQPQHMQYEAGKTHADILRDRKNHWNPEAAWRIEIKTGIKKAKPTSMHKADVVFLHVLGTDQIVVYLPTVGNADRTDDTYIEAGVGCCDGWTNVRIKEDWSITRW